MQKIKAVIFDLDGTLANTLPLCISAFRKSTEPLIGRSLSDADIIATFGPSEEGTIMALAPDHYEQGVQDYLRFYESLHNMYPVAFDGIPALLEGLKKKNIPISMVTGKGKYSTAISLKHFDLAHYFAIIETGSPKGGRKTEGINDVLKLLHGIDKAEVIYVGDAPSDILACRQAGIKIAAAAWADTAEPEALNVLEPDEIFYSIPDFAEWLYKQL